MKETSVLMNVSIHNLGHIDLIPVGEGRVFMAGAAMVAIFRTRSGKLFATQAHCPHKAGPLADGIVDEKTLICPLHSNKFDIETGSPIGNDCAPLKTYPVSANERGEIILTV